MRDRMGVRTGDGFEAKLAKLGRRLPRWARRDAQVIVEALAQETHPKLAVQIDHKKIRKAFKSLKYFLERQNAWTRPKNRFLDTLAAIAFVICVTIALVIAVMVWRGLV